MSEPTTQAPPPPPPPPTAPPPQGGSSGNRAIMLVLAYVWILALVPLLVEKDDKEVQWHAKNGLVILGLEFIIWILFTVVGMATGGLGCMLAPVQLLIWVAFIVIRVMCVVKALKGERFILPGVSQYADKF